MQKPLVILVTTATGSNKTAEENLGLTYLSSVCRENDIDVTIIDGWLEGLTSQEITRRILLERKPIFVGFSCNILNGSTAIKVVQALKSTGYSTPFVAGGFAPTFNPKKFLESGFDFVAMAESEGMIINLCKYLVNGTPDITEIDGLCYRDKQLDFHFNKPTYIHDLDKLPFPSRDTMQYAIKEKTPVNMITSRGCMSNCLFCSVNAFWKLGDVPKWRGRTIKNIVDEMEELYNKGARHVKFVDDSFIEPPREEEWCNNFADEIQNRGLDLRLRITLRADRVTDGIVDALSRAGCNLYACGIENFSDTALKRMGKGADSNQNREALDIFKRHNVYVQTGFILFDYGTTLPELKENYEMMDKYSWTICRGVFSEMFAANGTLYTELLHKKGLIKGDAHLGNYSYEIEDVKVQMVYKALKEWHISHMKMYNMVIEPINKPKVLSDGGLGNFYDLYLDIRKRDLDFMGKIITLVEKDVNQKYLDDFVIQSIDSSSAWFKNQGNSVEKLFSSEHISYMAEDDPFTR